MCKEKFSFSAVDLTYGAVLCFQCGDYVYDQELTAVAREHRLKAAKSLGMPVVYHSWEPSLHEIELLRRNPRRRKLIENTTIGEMVMMFHVL
jgi:ubiquitin carboxyl-terminal hydrolase 22/27/51